MYVSISVGKTSLMNRYATGKFTGQYKATIGADFVTHDCVVTNQFGQRIVTTLQIWDTAGQERFQSLGVGFYRGADAAVLVYDTTDPHSLDHLQHWQTEFLNNVGMNQAQSSLAEVQFPFVVVGNKIDKIHDRLVPVQRAEEWCRVHAGGGGSNAMSGNIMGLPPLQHYETSAKTAINVEDAFQEVARLALIYEDYKRRTQPQQLFVPPPTIDLQHQRSSSYNGSSRGSQDSCC